MAEAIRCLDMPRKKTALTDTTLKAIKPRDKTYTVSDDRGLYLEVFPTGGMVWRCHYRLNGKYEKLTLNNNPAWH